ncbi:hypothetical protein [Brunnivagina elsteri]|nr:hypothetical protein [Calothrix elsteri]
MSEPGVFDYSVASLRRKDAISKYDWENYSSQGKRGLMMFMLIIYGVTD